MKLPFEDIFKQAKSLQERFERMQEELARTEVTGVAGGGLVRVTMTADHAARRVEIDPSLLGDDRALLEDLIAAAINDAVRRVEAARKEKLGDATAGLPLPPGFKFPFST